MKFTRYAQAHVPILRIFSNLANFYGQAHGVYGQAHALSGTRWTRSYIKSETYGLALLPSAGHMVWYMVVLVSGLDAKLLKIDKIMCLIIKIWPALGFSV
jgi:hypothetical protein